MPLLRLDEVSRHILTFAAGCRSYGSMVALLFLPISPAPLPPALFLLLFRLAQNWGASVAALACKGRKPRPIQVSAATYVIPANEALSMPCLSAEVLTRAEACHESIEGRVEGTKAEITVAYLLPVITPANALTVFQTRSLNRIKWSTNDGHPANFGYRFLKESAGRIIILAKKQKGPNDPPE